MRHSEDHSHLLQALTLAKLGRGFCAPNPSVGAVIVDPDKKIIAQGYHQGPGLAHAEVEALKNVSNADLSNSTLYVTLEPCCHFGRTPPCTDAIIKAGIKRVIYGHDDPNPVVAGKGASILKKSGISCERLSLAEVTQFYQSYDYWRREQKPFVTAKLAMSLNGAIAAENSQSVQITGPELQILTHEKRKMSDAILTTAKTIIADNPQLNARSTNNIIAKKVYIIDRNLNIPLNANIFNTAKSIVIFHSTENKNEKINELAQMGILCIHIAAIDQVLSLSDILSTIGKDGIHDLWIEAGGKLLTNLLENKLIQRLFIYIAPKWIANGQLAFAKDVFSDIVIQNIKWEQKGSDIYAEINLS